MKRFPQSWEATTLGEHVDIQTGFPFKSQRYVDDVDGIRLLRGDNIVQGALRWEGVKKWTSAERHDYPKYELRADDVVLAMDRPWIEAGLKYAWISEHDLPCLLVQRVSRLRGSSSLLTHYIRYLIGHHSFTDYLKGIWTGIAVPHISESQIRAFKILLPPVSVQERIIAVLSAYDDLIENNTRRIKILEEMAQMLYREWFVHFRFPGHEKVRMVESELGPIPERWTVAPLGKLTSVVTKGTTPTTLGRQFQESGINFVKVESITESGQILPAKLAKIDGETHDLLKRSQLVQDDILFSIAGAIGRVALVRQRLLPANTNQALAIIRCSDRDLVTYLLSTVRSDHFQNFSLGRVVQTAQANVSLSILKSAPILLPPRTLLYSFQQAAEPLMTLVDVLSSKNEILRTTRDLLLPKLISGEIQVEAAEGAAAAIEEEIALHA